MISIFKNISKSSSNIILFVKINIEKTKISNLKSYKVNNKLIFDYSVATQSSGIQVNIFLREAPGSLNTN